MWYQTFIYMIFEREKNMNKALLSNRTNGYSKINEDTINAMNEYCERYKDFLNRSRTERTTVANAIEILKEKGFKEYDGREELKPGDRIYFNNRKRSLIAAVVGEASLAEGINIVASHVDSPRFDIRPVPLVEDNDIALLKTHHYGWVRNHQWVSIPLMLTGVVYLADGTKVDVTIGDDPEDPVLVIPDLLPHISGEQDKLDLKKAYPAEKMNIYLATQPVKFEDNFSVKFHALCLLNKKYGIIEDDFISAELEAVPAIPVRDVGIDRSLIGGYGHDDRVCGYAALEALVGLKTPKKTAVLLWADKEEIGNVGIGGAASKSFDYYVGLMCRSQGVNREDCYQNSFCLSADVTVAYDPNYSEYFSKENTAVLNSGIAIQKYTGHGGKENASDAPAELVSKLRTLFNENGILFQSAEMGRLDLGGGGTVALEFTNRGIDTIDAGVAMLCMHSPFEIVAKLDCYMTHKAYKTVFES